MIQDQKIALVTGANSGIGFETVKQLSDLGYTEIILACRTIEKGELAIKKLLIEGFKNIYSVLSIDVSNVKSSKAALNELILNNKKIELLVLNACSSLGSLKKNDQGMELTFASALLGHHILTKGLYMENLLSQNARIVTAGSEAARGDVPMMSLPKIEKIVQSKFNGNFEEMMKSFMFPKSIKKHSPMRTYALAKLCVSLWTSSVDRKLPDNIIVNSISPGATPSSNFARHQSVVMRKMMMPMMEKIGPLMGMSGSLSEAAFRYLKILDFDKTTSGKLWMSKKGKMAGPLVILSSPYLDNVNFQDAIWKIMDEAVNIQTNNESSVKDSKKY